jgi:flavin reductase (DIM6/NTAB) family NADH-FMN oxidoreductase RutF
MFATGVTILTARDPEGQPIGLTVNSFNSVSLEPPLIVWSMGRAAASLPAFRAASHYVVHVLGVEQRALAERFATRGADRWAGVDCRTGSGDAPVIAGCAATFECFNYRRHEEGDHVLFIGRVERCAWNPDASPLLFHDGRFYTEHPL